MPNYFCKNMTVSSWPSYGNFYRRFKCLHVSGCLLMQLDNLSHHCEMKLLRRLCQVLYWKAELCTIKIIWNAPIHVKNILTVTNYFLLILWIAVSFAKLNWEGAILQYIVSEFIDIYQWIYIKCYSKLYKRNIKFHYR